MKVATYKAQQSKLIINKLSITLVWKLKKHLQAIV
jgi:hypothetical protein